MTDTALLHELLEQARITPSIDEYLDREEVGDAELVETMFADRVAFDHEEKRWYLCEGNLWIPDQLNKVFTLVENQLAAEYLGAAKAERRNGNAELSNQLIIRAKKLLNWNRIKRVTELASHRERLALRGDEWDTPPLELPVRNGIIDLRDGSFRSAVPTDHVRSCAPVEWRGLECAAPRWRQFLQEIFGGDAELVACVRRLLGSSIAAGNPDHVFPILWGEGANGKSTLVDAVSDVLGEGFCFTTQPDSLMDMRDGDGNAARPFIHAQRGKRIVFAPELKPGRRLNTGLMKQLTGDRKMTARALYKGPSTFEQTYTIFLVANHCPRLPDGDDYAVRRRILRIPFDERFVDNPQGPHEHKIDRELSQRLRNESAGILAWLVQGCLEWQSHGLSHPASVAESTEAYLKDEDLFGEFVGDRLQVQDGIETPASLLYKEYSGWCEESGTRPESSRSFGKGMTHRFGPSVPKWVGGKTERIYRGVGLATHQTPLHITELTHASANSSQHTDHIGNRSGLL